MEALIALVLLAMGVATAVGVAASSLRSTSAAAHAGRGAWLALMGAGELARRAEGDGRCAEFSAGTRTAPGGTTLSWSFRPERHGLTVLLISRYPVSSGFHSDTMWSFVPCR